MIDNLHMRLDQILNLDKWQKVQDSLAQATGLAIITVDYKGKPITKHSGRRKFCGFVRDSAELSQYCQKCDSRGGLESVRNQAPYIYLCHRNIVDLAIPITINDNYIGAVMAGQVKLPTAEESDKLEKILISPSGENFSTPDLQQLYDELPCLSLEDIYIRAQMLFQLCNYIVEEAMNKNIILKMYEESLPSNHRAARQPIENIEQIKKELSSVVTNSYIKSVSTGSITCKNPVLKPAFEYIYNNRSETLTQKKLAEICHISSGHFSRLFTKETGESVTAFVARQKIEWSKQWLEKTNLSVSQISDRLGFSTPGYFIKVFKKHENLTPLVYKSYYQDIGSK